MAKTIEFPCPECTQPIVVGAMLAGHQVRCPHCRSPVTAPQAGDSGETTSGRSIEEPSRRAASEAADVEAGGHDTPDLDGGADAGRSAGSEPDAPEWFLRIPEGLDFGPVTRSQLEQWVVEGRVDSDCFVRRDGDIRWRQAVDEFPVLADVTRCAPATDVVEALTPHLEPGAGAWVLALAILGWLTLCPLFPIWAWLLATVDLNRMNLGLRYQDQRPWTVAGMRLAVLEITLIVAAALTLGLVLGVLSLA